jgi:hypothetical protein
MSMPSSAVSHKRLQDLMAVADGIKRKMSELQACRAQALHISEGLQRRPRRIKRVS